MLNDASPLLWIQGENQSPAALLSAPEWETERKAEESRIMSAASASSALVDFSTSTAGTSGTIFAWQQVNRLTPSLDMRKKWWLNFIIGSHLWWNKGSYVDANNIANGTHVRNRYTNSWKYPFVFATIMHSHSHCKKKPSVECVQEKREN